MVLPFPKKQGQGKGLGETSLMFVKLFACNSGAGNGCANFMGTWNFCILSAGKPPCHKIPRFRGGGYGFSLWGGGGGVAILFLCARDFSDCCNN